MLHRSFKPAKCKTSLKLAASRLKLLKNKKEVQLKQLKRELTQLLESGQDQTARIRVEHVVREEKMVAAYDLLEIYCEIIAARLPIIESQKNCPIDLKEAITSVIFASPRCADITEFVDIRKHFTAKYGKEFVTAAVELRPESGVSRMLVEKLSVKAPDGETKVKILSAIAEEHNIKWDPTPFVVQELKPPDDLLNGPNTFENASTVHTEPAAVQTGPSNVQVPPSPDPKDTNTPASFKQNASSSPNLQNLPSVVHSGPMTTETAAYPGTRPSGSGSERLNATHSHYSDGNAYSAGSHKVKMEFKDATAAAEAAAEAAERASMAARAAAELSGRAQITTAHSTESHRLTSHSSRDDQPSESVGSKFSGKQFSKGSRKDTVRDNDPKIQSDQVDRNEHVKQEELSERFHRDSRNSIKRTSLASLKPTNASNDDDKLMNEHQGADLYLHKRQQEEKVAEVKKNRVFSAVNMNKEYSESDVGFQSDDKQDDLYHEGFNHLEEERVEEKASGITSQSHSSSRDNVNGISHSSHRTSSIDPRENLFLDTDRDATHGVVSSSYSEAAVVFDDPLSDNDDFVLDTHGLEDPSPNSYHNTIHKDSVVKASSSSNAAVTSEESDADDDAFGFSSRTGYGESLTETKDCSREKDVLPVQFDDFGGPSSESEDELVKSGFGKLNHNQSDIHCLKSKRKQKLHMPPGDKEQVDVIADNDQRVELDVQSSMKFDSDYIPSGQLPSRHSKTSLASNSIATDNSNAPELGGTMTDDRYFNQSSTESKNELKFGTLRGGLRNKRSSYAIYPPVDATATSKRLPEDMANTTEQATPSSSIEKNPSSKTSTRLTDVYSDDTDDLSKQTLTSGRTGVSFSRRTKATSGSMVTSSLNDRSDTEFKEKLSLQTSVTGSDSNDSEEELSEKHFNRKRQPSSVKSSQQSNVKLQSGAPLKYSDLNDGASDAFEHTSTISGLTGTVPSRRTKASPSSGTKSSMKARVSNEAISSDADLEEKPSSSFYGSEEELSEKHFDRKRQPSSVKPSQQSNVKLQSGAPLKYSDSNDGDSDAFEHTSTISGLAGTVPSRRTKASPSSGTKSSMKARVSSEAMSSDADLEEKPSSSFYGSETRSKPESQKVKPARQQSTERATSKPISGNIPKHDLNSKSSAKEQTPSTLNTVASGNSGSPNPSASSGNDPSKEDTLKKASHVHPKLPDYDSLAAHLQSLRENRQ